jgi:hypothetical protein
MSETVSRHSHRSLVIQAVAVIVELKSGNMKIPMDMDIPDLNKVVDYPDTDEACNAAGFVVTNCQIICMAPFQESCTLR